ncbi:MAG: ArsR family transcriptional regulator [Myxococcales bacterium]|nr:MAG: ArsR family transcriptional regulator [Myxococcales bacterium]
MRGREFKDALFATFAEAASAFASPKRIEIIDVLAQGERNVETLAAETGQTLANASRHLQMLKQANLVAFRKEGVQVYYRLAGPAVLQGYRALQRLAEDRLAEVDRLARDFFAGADGLEPLEKKELLRRVKAGEAAVVDVRPAEEFSAGHVKGALSIPLAELKKHLDELPKDKRIVAYCRGPYCVLAAEAVRLLREKGFDAVRMKDGYPEWRDAGLPVEAAARNRS